ncbi:hypothetical protein Syun_005270 [Stephania yunnanensis]|uniref:K Homology domain-containing protein n=1 Tax=Stephania yunnanensis TaxID=152371 RepID=A0AAP0L4G9_9MAGN
MGGGGGAEGGEEEAQTRPDTDNNNTSKRKLDDIQLAKQKAQEIVARLVNDAESKRPRLDDAPHDSFSSQPPQFPDGTAKLSSEGAVKPLGGSVSFASHPVVYYSSQGSSKKIEIPNGKVGVIIGRAGETIKQLQLQSGAKIQVTKDSEADFYSQTRDVELTGTPEQISRAEELIKTVIAEQTDAGGSGSTAARGFNPVAHGPGAEQIVMKVPNNKVAVIIGKGGENIKNMQARTGAHIQIIPLHLPPGDTSTERNVYVSGTSEQIEMAKQLITEAISENRFRNPSMQQGYHPPSNWGPPGQPPQQPGYGYTQTGAYPPPPSSYYGSYPQQPSGWEQANPSYGQTQQTPGYNYYGQTNESGTGQAGVNYGYGQTPQATSTNYDQGYNQQPQSYGHDASSQGAQHDPQKSYQAPGYGQPAVSSQADGNNYSQPYGAQASTQPPPTYQASYSQPTSAPAAPYSSSQGYAGAYPSQPSYDQTSYVQPGYGGQPPAQAPPPMSQPPVYGQGGYPPQQAPAQSGYPPTSAPYYGQMAPQAPTQPTMYVQPLAYGAESSGNGTTAAPSNVTPAAPEPVHPPNSAN